MMTCDARLLLVESNVAGDFTVNQWFTPTGEEVRLSNLTGLTAASIERLRHEGGSIEDPP